MELVEMVSSLVLGNLQALAESCLYCESVFDPDHRSDSEVGSGLVVDSVAMELDHAVEGLEDLEVLEGIDQKVPVHHSQIVQVEEASILEEVDHTLTLVDNLELEEALDHLYHLEMDLQDHAFVDHMVDKSLVLDRMVLVDPIAVAVADLVI